MYSYSPACDPGLSATAAGPTNLNKGPRRRHHHHGLLETRLQPPITAAESPVVSVSRSSEEIKEFGSNTGLPPEAGWGWRAKIHGWFIQAKRASERENALQKLPRIKRKNPKCKKCGDTVKEVKLPLCPSRLQSQALKWQLVRRVRACVCVCFHSPGFSSLGLLPETEIYLFPRSGPE